MPTRIKKYRNVEYPPEVFVEAYSRFKNHFETKSGEKISGVMSCGHDEDIIEWEEEENFLEQNPFTRDTFYFVRRSGKISISISKYFTGTIEWLIPLSQGDLNMVICHG